MLNIKKINKQIIDKIVNNKKIVRDESSHIGIKLRIGTQYLCKFFFYIYNRSLNFNIYLKKFLLLIIYYHLCD